MADNFYPHYLRAVHHDGSERYVRRPHPGVLKLGDEVNLLLRTLPGSPVRRVLVRTCPDGEQFFTEMTPREDVPPCRWWHAAIKLAMPVTHYRFLLFSDDGAWWYNGSGIHVHLPTDAHDFRLLAGYQPPEWVRKSVFYQVFPDRFANGDPSNDVQDGEYEYWGVPSARLKWGQKSTRTGRASMVEFYGGDLAGIESRLEYLGELGVNALYLNPIFTSFSNHRYDVVDFENVDPHLGGNQALVSLRRAARRLDMRLVLDITPNHCGVMHPWFQAALADPDAPTAEFFTFFKHPDEYAAWLGVRTLPKLNYLSDKLRSVMYAGKDAILRRWVRPPYSTDGWRLDVANMLARQGENQLGIEVGRGIRKAIREANPEAYILGENFFDATHQLMGDCWDAVMNYSGFNKPLRYWLAGFYAGWWGGLERIESPVPYPTAALTGTWEDFRASIPWEIARQQFNLLGSHDTARILARLGGNRDLARLAAAALFTYPGVPCIYYGDEVGMGSGEFAGSRDCMSWDRSGWDLEMFSFYKTLAHLRRESSALIQGGFQVLVEEENFLAYQRDAEDEIVIAALNRGHEPHPAGGLPVAPGGIPDGIEFTEIISGQKSRVESGILPLKEIPQGAQIWRAHL